MIMCDLRTLTNDKFMRNYSLNLTLFELVLRLDVIGIEYSTY